MKECRADLRFYLLFIITLRILHIQLQRPPKLSLGLPHPDPVVETSSLSAVQPPEPTYSLTIIDELNGTNTLSCLQIETVVYACQVSYLSLFAIAFFMKLICKLCIASLISTTFFYGRGIFIIYRLVLEQVSSLVMELVLVKAVLLLD